MDPMTMALQGGGALLDAFMSFNTNKTNNKIAQQNQLAALEAQAAQQRAALEARNEARLGTTDAHGNRLYFDPQKGWVTQLTGKSQAIADQQLEEQLLSLFRDAPQRRRAEDENEIQRGQQRDTANTLMEEFRRIQKGDPESMRGMLYDRARMGIDEGLSDVENTAMRSAMRTGNSNTGAIVAQLAKTRGNELRKASLDAAIGAEDRVNNNFNNARNSTATLYQAFADRASRLPQTAYAPANVTAGTTGALPTFAAQAGASQSALINAFGNAPKQDYQSADHSIGNAMTTLGSIWGQHQKDQTAETRYQQSLDAIRRRNTGSY